MHYIGLDVHKRVVEAAVLDETGRLAHRERFACTHEALERFARAHLTKQDALALEATTNTWEIVAVLEPHVGRLVVSNPLRTRAIAEAKIKTDRVDARVLAELLRAGYLPSVWQPDASTRALRHVTARRAALVSARTAAKNRLHAVLHQRLVLAPMQDLFGPRGRRWLASTAFEPLDRAAIDSELRLLDAIEAEIASLEHYLAGEGYADPRVRLLLTLPGVDRTVAQALLAAWGDVRRFESADRAASYLGLVPSTRQSAERCYHGPITKRGRGHARWLLVQAAQHLGTHPGPLGVFFRRIARKKGRNVAVVATARKLATLAWQLLTTNQPYRYALPQATATKLARLRVAATGVRRRSGNAKGTPRPAAYGTGQGTRAVPALDRVYTGEGLPTLAPAKPGEIRMLEDTQTADFAISVRQDRRIPRRSGSPRSTAARRPKESANTEELTRS
jgi:transposase